jgi:hypothetical protein
VLGRLPAKRAALALLSLAASATAQAYPYGELRPADQVIGGPTDGFLSALHFNPAALRLATGSQLTVIAGGGGSIGGYQRHAALPQGFSPDPSIGPDAESTRIGWFTSTMLVAGSWDLRTDAVTLGFALYTPNNDETHYAGRAPIDAQQPALERLASRYHAVTDYTYSLRGTIAVGLRLRPKLYLGGGFQFAYTHSKLAFLRDLSPTVSDGLSCAGSGPCEQWSQRLLLDVDVAGWGYGFSAGILAELLDDRLWLGASYISTLFTGAGAEVGLDGGPQQLPWLQSSSQNPCGDSGTGLRLTTASSGPQCGAAHLARSFPHIIYLGTRGRLAPSRPAVSSDSGDPDSNDSLQALRRLVPTTIELTGWLRLTVPSRDRLVLSLDQRLFPAGELVLPVAQRTAVALAFGVRQLWSRLILAEELLYQSPRSDPAAISPANLEGHQLDLSLAARIKLERRLWLLLTLGTTASIFGGPAGAAPGSGFSPDLAGDCRAAGYDINTTACRQVQAGWAAPSPAGSYWLVRPHGVVGLEVNL